MCNVRVVWQRVVDDADPDLGPGAADRLLADEVADVLGCSPDDVGVGRHCPRCGGREHGRPVVITEVTTTIPYVSLARADGIVVVAVSLEDPVGIDVERADQTWPSGSTDVLLHPLEQAREAAALTTLWVRKESLLKATGDGLRVEPSGILLGDPCEPPRVVDWPAGPGIATGMRDLEIDGYIGCVAVLDHQTVQVTQRQAVRGDLSRPASLRTAPAGPDPSGPGPAR